MENEAGNIEQRSTEFTPLEFNLGDDVNYYQADLRSNLFYVAVRIGATRADIDDFDGKEVSAAFYSLAEEFTNEFDVDHLNSGLTRKFLGQVVPDENWLKLHFGEDALKLKPDPLWIRAWRENIDLQKVVTDALLSRAEKDALATNKTEDLEIIRQARELLRLSNYTFLSSDYQGTSSAVLGGIEQANGKILSSVKLRELGIARKTGEGFLHGGGTLAAENDGISVSSWFEVGDTYSLLCCEEYNRNPKRVGSELNDFQSSLSYEENQLNRPERWEGEHEDIRNRIEELRKGIQIIGVELGILETQAPDEQESFPIIFGLKDLKVVRSEDFYGSSRVGHEIDLHSQLQAVYVPLNKVDTMKEWGQINSITEMTIYPVEAVRLLRLMNPEWDWIRQKMENRVGKRNLRGEKIVA